MKPLEKRLEQLEKRFDALEEKLTLLPEVRTDMQWIKRIIIGAASLGFIEKLIGWVVK